MNPEIAIERVRSFLRWNCEKLERLDALHEAIPNPLGWRRGAEYWIPSTAWHEIFEKDEDAALIAAQALRDSGLLRTQTGPSLQCNVKVRKEVRRCYCVSERILAWRHGSKGYNPDKIELPFDQNNLYPAVVPADGSPPGLAAKLENVVSLALDEAERILRVQVSPDDRAYQAVLRAKTAIFNGALVNQVRVDEVKFQARDDKPRIKQILDDFNEFKRKFDAEQAERDKEDARLARENGYCDDSLSDKLAAQIYREKTCPWGGKPDRPP